MNKKPSRTLGLSLAIIASAMLFSILPLLQVIWVLLIQARFASVVGVLPQTSNSQETEAMATGGNLAGISNNGLIIQAVIAIMFLVVTILAWKGRPPQIRWIMLAAVLGLTAINLWQTISTVIAPVEIQQGIDSGVAIARQIACGTITFQVTIPLYVVWYMNRAPARAFYQGNQRAPIVDT